MKTELENFNSLGLSINEMIHINGGGPGWNWLGQVCGIAATVVNFINDIPINTVIGIANIEGYIQTQVDVYNRR